MEPSKPDLEAIRAKLEKEQYDYATAWCNKDMDYIDETWGHEDITMWGIFDNECIIGWEGPNGGRKVYEGAFSSSTKINFSISDLYVKVALDGNSAVITYNVKNEMTQKDGSVVTLYPRITVVKERRGDKWKIMHATASYSVKQVNDLGLCK
ncbi:YybH family protein [Candidatus Latescibacterota bacterium]